MEHILLKWWKMPRIADLLKKTNECHEEISKKLEKIERATLDGEDHWMKQEDKKNAANY